MTSTMLLVEDDQANRNLPRSLMQDNGYQVIQASRVQLVEDVWDYSGGGDGRLMDTHVARLWAKIETVPGSPQHLLTVRGLGYEIER